MIKATRTITITILGFVLASLLFLVTLPVLPSSVLVQTQEMSANTTSPSTKILENTTLTSQPSPSNVSMTTISIVKGSSDPNNGQFYVPSIANITVGASVKWINDDPIPHTVTSGTPEDPGKEFDSKFIKAGDSFIHTFSKKGLFVYFCLPHPWMTGKVSVS